MGCKGSAFAVSVLFFYGLTAWVGLISFTHSEGLLKLDWAGLDQYRRLWSDDAWWQAMANLLRFGPVAIVVPLVAGCLLAILLDQRIRGEGVIRTLYLYPLALSFVVAGTIWRWMLAPDTGLQQWLRGIGFAGAEFDWLVSTDKSIYTLAIVQIWHSTGFIMAMFIAGLRGIDDAVFKAALLDGASLPRVYWRIVLPALRPTFFSALLLLLPVVIKTFDLVVVLTQGGPGQSSVLPAYFMFDRFFQREQMGLGAASGVLILTMSICIAVPYVVIEMRKQRREQQ